MDLKKMSSFFDKKKSKGPGLSANEKSVKINVLKDLQHRAGKAMSSKLHGIKTNPTMEEPKSEFGSDHADKSPEEMGAHEATETPEMESSEDMDLSSDHGMKPIEHMNEDEVDHHLQKLMAHKAKLKGKF